MADNKEDEGLWVVFLSIGLVLFFTFIIWVALKQQLLQLVLWIRQGEMWLASLWTPADKVIPVTINGRTRDMTFEQIREVARSVTPEALLSDDYRMGEVIAAISVHALTPYTWIFGVLLVAMMVTVFFRGPTSLFRRTHDLEGLMAEQSKTFRTITPFLKFNPQKQPVRPPGAPVPQDLPLFAEALSPEEWIAYNQIPMPEGEVDEAEARKAFAKQMLGPWRGWKALPKELQILLAAFCLKASRKRAESDEMLGRLACCWDHKSGISFAKDRALVAEARRVLKDKDLSGIALRNANRHAFITTALLHALDTARQEGGVLAPAQFVWLRGHNRTLWYPLNNLGRQGFHPEAVGAMAHYRMEKQIDRPIPKVRVQDAVDTLKVYLADKSWAMPIPTLDYSASKGKSKKNIGIMKPAA